MSESASYRWPLRSNYIRRGLTNHTYGKVRDNNTKNHQGWDLYAVEGTPCYAIGAGKVVATNEQDNGDYGLTVVIELSDVKVNNQKIYAFYAHLKSITVTNGDEVKLGDEIGETGLTGNAKDMKGDDQHLHFEIRTANPPGGRGLTGRLDPKDLYSETPLTAAKADNNGI